ncbi:MAG: DUF5667 domain-containing protein [Chloroflexi bacterium]|nr:DUF5667 domain-containing protein [Chloroflexota bacterium]
MKNEEMDSKLNNAFNDFQNIPLRDPQAAARGRANFLKQAAVLRQSVSREADQRHNRWSNRIFLLFQRRQRLPVLNTLIAVVLAVVVFFGGSGVTVYAAQNSLPDQALYPVKTWSEDAILSLTGSAQMRLVYVLDFSDRRVVEMGGMLAAGKPIPEGVETRLQNELDLALELIAGMDDSQALLQLEQVRQRAEAQYHTMTKLMSGAPESAEPLLLRTYACLQEQIRLATMGEMDLQGFRMQIRQRFQDKGGSGEQTPGTGNNPQGTGPMSPTDMPGPSGNGYGPGPDGIQPTEEPSPINLNYTPVPSETGNGSGPGWNQPTKEPGPISPNYTPVRSETGISPGPGWNQPSGTPGQHGSGSQTPKGTPQPGEGSGHGP